MSLSFSIPVKPPYPWDAVLRYLTYRSTPGVEIIEPDRYTRRTATSLVTVSFDPDAPALLCSVDGACDGDAARVRIARLFDADHDPAPAGHALRRSPLLRPRLRKLPGVRAPGCWEPFEFCLRVVLGQQVSVKGAHTLMGRLAARCPGLDPARLAEADLAKLGITTRREETLRRLAVAVAERAVVFDQPWPQVSAQLSKVPGFGPWTLQYLAIRLGRDADAFPAQDLGLLRAAGAETPRALLEIAEAWRPYRAYAAMYLWQVQ